MIALQISSSLPVSGGVNGGAAVPRLPICRNPSTKTAQVLRIKSLYLGRERAENLTSVAKGKRRYRSTVAMANKGGGGDWETNNNVRVLGNLALAVGLTYLTVTGQLGWVLDAIVSIWLLAVLLPILGLVAFFWFAGQDIIQDSCPNCGNEFQILKSSLKDGVQFCPFCAQPITVKENKFVMESARFSSNRSSKVNDSFGPSPRRSDKGKGSSGVIVDIEADVMDVD